MQALAGSLLGGFTSHFPASSSTVLPWLHPFHQCSQLFLSMWPKLPAHNPALTTPMAMAAVIAMWMLANLRYTRYI